MKTIWLALAATATVLGASAAQATIFTFDIQYWDGVGSPPTDDTDPGDFAHFVVDDQFGGTDSNSGQPTGIWTYGNSGSYFGLPFQDAFIDIYNDYWGGGFTFVPYVVDENGNDPVFDYQLDLYGPSALGGEPGSYHIMPGVYDLDDGYGDNFRVTIAQASATAAPEPASWALMLGGFGVVGGMLRQQRRAKVRFA
jgi:hypothetical protein